MRLTSVAVLAVLSIGPIGVLRAQEPEVAKPDRISFDIGAGLLRYGSHSALGLEYAWTRWLATRVEMLEAIWTSHDAPARNMTSVSLGFVVTPVRDSTITPYVTGGFSTSTTRYLAPATGPYGGIGIRSGGDKLQVYIEVRAQHRVGTPLSLGVRF